MSEPTSILTHYDLILRIAELAGVAYFGSDGAQRALIPIDDVNTFDKCKRIVNDGIRMFIAGAPPQGWRWKNRIQSVTFGSVEVTGTCTADGDSTSLIDTGLEDAYDTDADLAGYYVYDITQNIYALITVYTASGGDITVGAWLDYDDAVSSLTPAEDDEYAITDVKTVAGDKARYWLDEDFGRVAGEITWAKGSARGNDLTWAHETEIRARREVAVNTGYPQLAAVRRYRNQRRWEIIFDPSPIATDTILFPYELGFNELRMEGGISNYGGTTYLVDDDRWEPSDYFNGWIITLLDGTGRGSYAPVTDYKSGDGVATCTDGTSKISVASTGHGMVTGDIVTVAGTTDYNGTWAITRVDDDNFTFVDTYTSAQTGTWKQRQIVVAGWLKSDGKTAGIDPGTSTAYYIEPAYNKHPAGLLFDDAILAACKAQVEMQYEDIQGGYVQKFYGKDLPDAQTADTRTAPRKLGKMTRGGSRGYRRISGDILYYDINGDEVSA